MSTTWSNWAGNQVAHPVEVVTPGSTQDVVAALARAQSGGIRVKAVGAGHSFTGAAVTDGMVLRLDALTGLTEVDLPRRRVRVLAGTPLHVLNPALQALGLALPNLGDIDRQTISGAIATGTHGTGIRRQGIAAAVSGLTIALADGTLLTCSEQERPDVFQAARVGLGALGVVLEVELQCVPAFRLHAREGGEELLDLLERIQHEADANDHLDMHWFPHTDRVLVKRNNQVPAGEGPPALPAWRSWLDDDFLSNQVFELTNLASARWPGIVPRLNQVTSRVLSSREYTDDSWRVFCATRDVRFVESEYAVPRAAVADVLLALREWVNTHDVSLPFPVEVRFIGADDVWLSTAYERDNAYIAVHQYHRMAYTRYFEAFEAIVAEHEGRPHWGKLHTLDAAALRRLYPRFDDFLAVRDQLDPERRFANGYLSRVLGE
jgi:L-gulono-1,4-lactone dehydrogenase